MAPFLQVQFSARHFVRSSLVFGLLARRTWPLALPFGTLLRNTLPGNGWFPPTKSHSADRTASVLDKARGVLVFELTKFHYFIGLASSYCFVGQLSRSHFVGLIPCQHSPDHTGSFVGHGNGGHSAGLA
jgi:hypothetical protein